MLYEPSKTKRYILIGAIAAALAVLVIVAVPLIYRNKKSQTPVTKLSPQEKLQQDRIQKELSQFRAMQKNAKVASPTEEQIKKELDSFKKQKAELYANQPTPEQIQKELDIMKK
jgi:hypothetical protein